MLAKGRWDLTRRLKGLNRRCMCDALNSRSSLMNEFKVLLDFCQRREFVLLNFGLRLIKCKKFSVGNDKAIKYYKFSFNRNVTSHYLVEPLLPVDVEGAKLREFACNQLKFRIRGGLASSILHFCQSQWPRGIRHGSAAARLLGVRVRVLPMA